MPEFSKFYTRTECIKDIDINEYVLLAQDRDEKKGNKCFIKVLIKDFPEIDLSVNHHLYEILPPDVPVKPYFDLEMEYDGLDIETIHNLLDIFISWLIVEIKTVFAVELKADDFIILNSCRENKLSFHVIIQEHICFANVAEHKIFITYLWNRFLNPIDENEKTIFKQLTYKVKEETRFIFDKLVYGNFQNIRLIGQSKKGKNYILKIVNTKWNTYDTLIRLYNGVEKRKMVNIEPLNGILGLRIRNTMSIIAPLVSNPQSQKKYIVKDEQDLLKIWGESLFQKKQMTDYELDKLKPYQRALHLIPNTEQDWPIYFMVACAVRSCGGTRVEFIEWAKLSAKYNINDDVITGFDNLKKKTGTRQTYDLPLLRRFAKKTNPDYYKGYKECLYNFFNIDSTGLKVIKETSDFVSQQGTPDANNIDDPAKIIILHAYLGRGKTTAIKRKVIEYKSYLFLSPRQTFAKFISAEFNCPCYLDGIYNTNRLVISVESLLKLEYADDYELICIDECESIFTQFSSHTTNGKHVEIWNKLIGLIQKAKKVIFADAFISNRTLDMVRTLGYEATLIQNNTSPVTRQAIEINPKVFAVELIKSIKNNEKNYVCYSSVNKLIDTHNILRGNAIGNEQMEKTLDDAIIYHAKTNDSVFKTLDNINETWGNASIVMTSPTNTVGCSYSPPDKPPDFNKVWINASPTCCVRDTFQTQMRVRHLKDNTLIFCLPSIQGLNFAKKRYDLQFDLLDDYEKFNVDKKDTTFQLIDEIIKQRQIHDSNDKCIDLQIIKDSYENENTTPLALRQILHFNLYEQTVSTKHYKEMFYAYLSKCGYVYDSNVIFTDETDKPTDDDLERVFNNLSYANIKTITEQEQEHIQSKIQKKKATEIDKIENNKYWFNKHIRPDLDIDTRSHLFHDYYQKQHNRHIFENAYLEHKKNIDKDLQNDMLISGKGFELNKMSAVQLGIILQLNELLGIEKSIHNGHKITRENIQKASPYLLNERKNIYTAFSMRDQSKSLVLDFKSNMKLLSSIYDKWTGMKFIGQEKNTHDKQFEYYTTHTSLTYLMETSNLFK